LRVPESGEVVACAAARSAIRFSTRVFRSLSSLKVPQLANADGIGLRSIHPVLANM